MKNIERYQWNKPTFYIDEKDERYNKFSKYKSKHGISPDETWCLYNNISIFLVPRLKLFKNKVKKIGGHPGGLSSNEEWLNILDKIIFSFESIQKDDEYIPKKYLNRSSNKEEASEKYQKEIQEGIDLFSKYYFCLWW